MRARSKYSKVSAWLLIVLAVALGWLLPFCHMELRRPMIQEAKREQMLEWVEAIRHPPPPIRNPAGSITVDSPYALSDYAPEQYHPVASVLYGPMYLAGCWLAGWLYFRRSVPNQRRRVVLVAVSVIMVEWAGILGMLSEFATESGHQGSSTMKFFSRLSGRQARNGMAYATVSRVSQAGCGF